MKERSSILLQTIGFGVAGAIVVQLLAYYGGTRFGDWKLIFQGFDHATRSWGLATFFVLSVACILLLFRYERRLVATSLGTTLMVLRLLAILVLFLALMEPIWTWSYENVRTGRVIVAVDASESMDTVDEFATRAEKLRWAKALGLLKNSEQVDRWIAAYESGNEPEWVNDNEATDPAKREQISRARRENIDGLCKEVDKLSRRQIAERLLTQKTDPLLEKLSRYAQSSMMIFAGKATPMELDQLPEVLADQKLEIERSLTDLTQPLTTALAGPQDPPLAGIIVVSDGRDTAHPEMNDFLAKITGLGVPIHTVLIGSGKLPHDISVASLDYPESVFEDDTPVVKAILRQSGYANETATVVLEPIDAPNEKSHTQKVVLDSEAVEVSFPLKDLAAGQHRYLLKIEPLKDETREDNNERELAIQVVDDKADVLLVEGEARWEFRYLEAALSRDEQVRVDTVLFDQPYLKILPTTFFPRKLAVKPLPLAQPQGPLPDTVFKPYDLVIVGDASPVQIGSAGWSELDRYVREEGGTLVLVGGKRYLPSAYATDLVVRDLLPIENPRVLELNDPAQIGPPAQRGFRLQITPDGLVNDMFLMNADPLQNSRIWDTLPGHPWGVVGTARPAATVWAAALAPGEPGGLEAERNSAVIAQHYVGEGQVVWIGIDSTWRWRLRVGDVYHHRFWGQLSRWAVDFKASDAAGIGKFGLVKPIISETEEAVIRLRWDNRFKQQNPGVRARATLIPQGNHLPADEITLDMNPAGRGGQEEARISRLKPGQYAVKLSIQGAQINAPLPEVPLTVNREITTELKDVSANRELLEQMASVTGGKFFLPDQLDQIPELFANVTQKTSIHEEIPLYSHWSVLALFAFFMTCEWVLRKLNGLP